MLPVETITAITLNMISVTLWDLHIGAEILHLYFSGREWSGWSWSHSD
jgi:hypothetical protein